MSETVCVCVYVCVCVCRQHTWTSQNTAVLCTFEARVYARSPNSWLIVGNGLLNQGREREWGIVVYSWPAAGPSRALDSFDSASKIR